MLKIILQLGSPVNSWQAVPFRVIRTEKQGPLSQVENQAKLAVLLSVGELERAGLC